MNPPATSVRGVRVGAIVLAVLGGALLLGLHPPGAVRGASPEPTPAAGGDTRSAGEGPGLVGAPGLAIGGTILLGLVVAGLTVGYIRLTGGPAPAVAPVVRASARTARAAEPGGFPRPAGPPSDDASIVSEPDSG